jgi:hypothetical protein
MQWFFRLFQGSSPYDLKDADAWRSLAGQPAFPYDPMSLYPYGAGYVIFFNISPALLIRLNISQIFY